MIRIVLAGLSDDNWRIFRQTQWMGEVRKSPELATCPRLHFDIDEPAYEDLVRDWVAIGAGASRQAAVARLLAALAVEVRRS